MRRMPERDYVNVAAAGPVVWQETDGTFRMLYSATNRGDRPFHRVVAQSGMIPQTSNDGRQTIGVNWSDACEVLNNEDEHHCIHSEPCLGDIEPGETKTVFGRIVLIEGGAERARKALAT